MISSYEVGSIFRLVDEATPNITRITRAITELVDVTERAQGAVSKLGETRLPGLVRSMGSLERRMLTVGNAAEGMGTKTVAALDTIAVSLTGATERMEALAIAMGQVGAASRGVGGMGVLPPGGGRHGPGGRGPGGLHVSSFSARLPGGHAHFRGGSNLGMAAGGALAYGIYEEAEVEDIVARAMITGQLPVDAGLAGTEQYKQLREIIQRSAVSGGFSPRVVGEAVLGSERQFAGLPFAQRMQVLDTMLPYAMQESRLKETPLKQSAEALVGLAHMTGTYDPEKLPDLYRKFAYASQLTPKTLPQYTNALSYAMPSLVGGMGMDPDAVMFLAAMNQAAGIGSSKAGTWIQAFFGKLMPATGINMTKSQSKHNDALTQMGLLGADGKPTWMVPGAQHELSYTDANGNVHTRMSSGTDWMASLVKLSPILGTALGKMDDTKRLQTLDQLFGKQGGREAGLFNLPEFIGQFPQLAKQLKMAVGGDDVLKMYAEGSPVQGARSTFSELTVVLMNLGEHVLPGVVTGLKGLSSILQSMEHIAGGFAAKFATSAGAGAIAGGLIAGPPGAMVGGIIGGGLALAGNAHGGPHPASSGLPLGEASYDPDLAAAFGRAGKGGASMSKVEIGDVNVTVNSSSGDPKAIADQVTRDLVNNLSRSGMHNQGPGAGVHDSPFTSGTGSPF